MKIAKYLFLSFLAIFLVGCASCVPGVCGCALSIWPSDWEQFVATPALVADIVGLAGTLVSGIVFLVFWTRHRTIREAERSGLRNRWN